MKNVLFNYRKFMLSIVCIALFFPLSSFNNFHSPTCTGCDTTPFIITNSFSTQYEFMCGGGANCYLGTITTTATSKKIICCGQTPTCITLANFDGTSCLNFTKGEGYYIHRVGSTGHWSYFVFRTDNTVNCAKWIKQDASDVWSFQDNHNEEACLSQHNEDLSYIPKCLNFQTCPVCN
ncbi:MAG: hypothetical protein LH473_02530 [Chitinophagales bacterium]|nr:hypothetical protein [Chitinophagales bacterium]